ncbi:MAG: nitrous oxide reductase accessory protein NosL [Thermodesulfovibrionales bacterium]
MSKGYRIGFVIAVMLALAAGIVFAAAHEDIAKHKSCSYCGMDREQFGFSRMLIEYDDNTTVGVCSLHCAAVELAVTLDKTPKSIRVADMNTRSLVDAEKAFWVVGGKKSGVMSKQGKWAFEKKEDADAFVQANGGRHATFEEAIKAAYIDMYEDTKMIRDKRRANRMKMQGHQH